jgi:hypothetical protein
VEAVTIVTDQHSEVAVARHGLPGSRLHGELPDERLEPGRPLLAQPERQRGRAHGVSSG